MKKSPTQCTPPPNPSSGSEQGSNRPSSGSNSGGIGVGSSSGSEQSTGSAPTPGANSGYSGPIGGGYICNDGSVVKGVSQCRDGTAAWIDHTLFNMGYQSADGEIKYYHNDHNHVFSTMRGGLGNTDIHGPWAQGYNSRFGISVTDTTSENIMGLTYNNNTARIIQTAH